MRLLMITPSLKKAGPINVALNICSHIKCIDPTVTIDLLSLNPGELEADFEACCDNVFIMSPFNAMRYLINERSYDIVHSHCVLPDLLNAVFSRNVNKVSTLHNYIDVDYVFDKGYVKGTVLSLLHKFSLNKMNRVIACSESVSKFVDKAFALKTTFVRNGVVEGGGGGAMTNIQRYIIVGVFNKRKNHEVAIRGFVDAKKKNTELIVLGDGPLFHKIKNDFAHERNVKFLGNVSEPRAYMSQSDVFLSSSCAEGLPMALIEAMSESLTYILSGIDPHHEIHNMDVSAGMVGHNSPTFFSNAILSLDDENLVRMKALSKKVYSENLTATKMASGYLRIYKGIS